jgi:diaminopimelate decarboxylase
MELPLPASYTHLTHTYHYVTNYQQIGDMVTIEGSGAYCSGMSTKNYNSFPEVPEVILAVTGEAHVIRK